MRRSGRDQRGYLPEGKVMGLSVYIISATGSGLLKVGVSHNPNGRMRTLSTSLPYKLKVERTWPRTDAYQIEGATHDILAEHRLNGEWFNVTLDQAVKAVERAIAGSNVVALPVSSQNPIGDFVLANTEWHHVRLNRIDELRRSGRVMDRTEQRAWLDAGGMDDVPRPPIPVVAES